MVTTPMLPVCSAEPNRPFPRFNNSVKSSCKRQHILLTICGFKSELIMLTSRFLFTADEVFFCGTGSEINAVVSINNQNISNGNVGKFTNTIRELYLKAVNGKLPVLKEWCFKVSID